MYRRIGNTNEIILCKTMAALYKYPYSEHVRIVNNGINAFFVLILAMLSLCNKRTVFVSKDVHFEILFLLKTHSELNVIETDFNDENDFQDKISKYADDLLMTIIEPVTIPLYNHYDIKSICDKIKRYDAPVIVDNTFLSSYYYNPLNDGADIVIDSLTKYSNGHGDAMGGMLLIKADNENNRKIKDKVFQYLCYHGLVVEPLDAWLIQRGLSTFKLRMDRITDTATKVYHYLKSKTNKCIYYGKGGLITLTFNDVGYIESLLNATELCLNEFTFGQDNTLAIIYKDNLNERLPEEWHNCLRLSIGLEDPEDIINDFEQAFASVNNIPSFKNKYSITKK